MQIEFARKREKNCVVTRLELRVAVLSKGRFLAKKAAARLS